MLTSVQLVLIKVLRTSPAGPLVPRVLVSLCWCLLASWVRRLYVLGPRPEILGPVVLSPRARPQIPGKRKKVGEKIAQRTKDKDALLGRRVQDDGQVILGSSKMRS